MTIRISRTPKYSGYLRRLIVRLDGVEVARVPNGADVDIEGSGNLQMLRFHMDWTASKPLAITDPKTGCVFVEAEMPNVVVGFFLSYLRPRSMIACRIVGPPDMAVDHGSAITPDGLKVRALIAGDLDQLPAIRLLDQDQILTARSGPPLELTAAAVIRVLTLYKERAVSTIDAQEWASFVRRGYAASPGSGPMASLAIDYEPEFESAIAAAVSRLDELGDAIDGVLRDAEISELVASLS